MIDFRIDCRFDAILHLFATDNFLVRPMTASLLGNLVFNVDTCCTCFDHLPDGSTDIESTTPAGIDINQQG